jgi:zinc transport system ATP-binding protein
MSDERVLLELRGAVIGYDGRAVLDGVDLTVQRGEVLALLGANGSGKSTLVGGALGLAEHLGGEIELFGTDHRRFRERWRIGFVPQRTTAGGGLPVTVAELVSTGRLTTRRWIGRLRASDRAAVRDAIATVGLEATTGAKVSTLSGGQMRRAMIARALASDPELLILDEPTAGVDAENQHRLAETLAELVHRGTTIVLVTHELGPIESLVSRAVVLADGRVASDATVAATEAHLLADHTGEHHHEHGERPAVSDRRLMRW